jgi:methylglyoxal synthase
MTLKSDSVKCSPDCEEYQSKYKLVAIVTTSSILQKELKLDINCFKRGPLDGDQQIGELIDEFKLCCLIFLGVI